MERTPQELLDQPFAFTQLPVLLAEGFVRAARERGVRLRESDLEEFHRTRILTPLLRYRRDGQLIRRLARSDPDGASQLSHWHPTGRIDLEQARRTGRLHDPASERFIPRSRLRRDVGRIEFRASEYLYSPYQLFALSRLRKALPHMELREEGDQLVSRLDVRGFWLKWARAEDRRDRELAVVLSAFEPVYHPRITGTLRFGVDSDFDAYEKWRRKLPLTAITRWLGIPATYLRDHAAVLLNRADGVDPLGPWLEVVREADPEKWITLKGDARIAIDYRIAAEMLLRHYEDLAAGRRAPALPKPGERRRGEFDTRLKTRRQVDQVLTDYGLSPHPSLVLVLEGATEMRVFPQLLRRFGMRTDSQFIRIENAEGVNTGLAPLIAFAAAPRALPDSDGRYLRLSRPLTRILVVTDAEGRMATKESRVKRREAWIERLLRTQPKEHRTKTVRDALERLVHVETWNSKGQSFEFAHFTDRQLAAAISMLDGRARRPALEDRREQIAKLRERRGSLDSALHGVSKLDLADALWPVLDAKITRALPRSTEDRIPVVRILDRVIELVRGMRRGGVVIPLSDE